MTSFPRGVEPVASKIDFSRQMLSISQRWLKDVFERIAKDYFNGSDCDEPWYISAYSCMYFNQNCWVSQSSETCFFFK